MHLQQTSSRVIKSGTLLVALVAWVGLLLVWTGRWSPFQTTERTTEEIQAALALEIAGQDRDGDGLRDDVAAWVDGQFGGEPLLREAFLQVAGDYQAVLLGTGNLEGSLANLLRLSGSLGCVRHVAGDRAEPLLTSFKAVTLDSDLRVRAWLTANNQWTSAGMDGMAAPSPSGCRFPVPDVTDQGPAGTTRRVAAQTLER